MKLVFYKDEKKIFINNVFVPEFPMLEQLIDGSNKRRRELSSMDMHKAHITSVRGMYNDCDVVSDELLAAEIKDGISWRLETVN